MFSLQALKPRLLLAADISGLDSRLPLASPFADEVRYEEADSGLVSPASQLSGCQPTGQDLFGGLRAEMLPDNGVADAHDSKLADTPAPLSSPETGVPDEASAAVTLSTESAPFVDSSRALTDSSSTDSAAVSIADDPALLSAASIGVMTLRSAQGPPERALDSQASVKSVVLIDRAVEDYQQLVASLPANASVLVLDPSRDGINQVTDFLQTQSRVAAVHIVSHGRGGEVALGSSLLNSTTCRVTLPSSPHGPGPSFPEPTCCSMAVASPGARTA